MAGADSLEMQRLVTKVAWLYHNRGMRQGQIGERLGMSQSRVSRLLEAASSMGIVRTVVVPPEDLHAEIEGILEELYGLAEAHVFDVGPADDTELTVSLGRSLSTLLEARVLDPKVIGVTSWSRSLREMIAVLRPVRTTATRYVVEMLGDVGPPQVQHEAADATSRLAKLTEAEPVFLRVAGVVSSLAAREVLVKGNHHVKRVLRLLDNVDLALVGIGACKVVPPLRAGDNFFTTAQFERAKELGAVGEVNLRFIDADGHPVASELDDLVVGITLKQLSNAGARLGVAGGPSKYAAIRAALLGHWLTILVTDVATAQWLVDNHPSRKPGAARRAPAREGRARDGAEGRTEALE